MPIVGLSSVERTFVQAVNRIVRKIGENEVATLVNNQSKRINIAMAAVEDARDEVWYHTNWEFKRGFFDITLVEDQMWYALPDDHESMGSPISLNRKAAPVVYKAYEDLLDLYPDLRSFPPGSGIGGLVSATQLAAQSLNKGEPDYYTTWGGYVGMIPIPDEAFVDLESVLYASYWKQAQRLVNDADDIGLPRNLWGAADLLALGNLKKALEMSDWNTDKAEGVRQMARESNSSRDPQDDNVYHDQGINYNE